MLLKVLLGDVQHSIEDSTSVNHEYAKILVDCAATPSMNRKSIQKFLFYLTFKYR